MRIQACLLALLVPSMLACGSPSTVKFDSADGGAGAGGFGDGSTGTVVAGDGGAGNQLGCSEAAKLVYVVTSSSELFSFKPDTGRFAKIGELDCPALGATPNSMAVDRAGTAWVNYSDGSLFEVSTADASCKATAYQRNQGGFERFGMAFATDSATSQSETLYVVGIVGGAGGKGLGKIDLSTMKLTVIGDFSGTLEGQGAELTGTGDGRLFGFFTTSPNATLAQIDKATGATTDAQSLAGVSTGSAWAFSFWGGDFWFYTSPATGAPSSVTRKQASGDGSLSVTKPDVGGFRIVGAGVSTCAPTEPPR